MSILIKNLSTGYRSKSSENVIAECLNGGIEAGSLTCLLGVNGAGKSTLLRTLAGFQPPLSGEVRILEKAIETYSGKALSQTVGVVLTDKPEVRDMTVRDLVGLGRNPFTGFWGRLRRSDEKAIDRAIEQMRISDLADRSVHTLSDGERQKAMIAKTLAQQTPIIILDEPTAFLDFPSRVEIMRFLLILAREHQKTVFLSTHDLELALQTADNLWLLDREKGLTIGKPNDLAEQNVIEQYFKCEGAVFDKTRCGFKILH